MAATHRRSSTRILNRFLTNKILGITNRWAAGATRCILTLLGKLLRLSLRGDAPSSRRGIHSRAAAALRCQREYRHDKALSPPA